MDFKAKGSMQGVGMLLVAEIEALRSVQLGCCTQSMRPPSCYARGGCQCYDCCHVNCAACYCLRNYAYVIYIRSDSLHSEIFLGPCVASGDCTHSVHRLLSPQPCSMLLSLRTCNCQTISALPMGPCWAHMRNTMISLWTTVGMWSDTLSLTCKM